MAIMFDLPEDDDGNGAWLHEPPEGIGPRLSIHPGPRAQDRVEPAPPRPPARRHRHHRRAMVPDHRRGRPADRRRRTLRAFQDHHVVMADPEGNEFCVA